MRTKLKWVGLFLAGLLFLANFGGAPVIADDSEVTIQFATWTYDLSKVRDNVAQFEKWTRTQDDIPNTNVDIVDFGFAAFRGALTTRFMAGAEIDVLYGSDAWLSGWAMAGFVAPWGNYAEDISIYKDDMIDYVWDSLTFEDELYGLIYYADHMQFVYNERLLEEAGIASPPTTWDEVREQCEILIEKGVSEEPFFIPISLTPWLEENFFSMVYSEGGNFFDDEGNPTFGDGPSGTVYEVLSWIVDAYKDGIIAERAIDMQVVDIQEIFKDGLPAFVIVPSYMLAEFQHEATSEVAGDAKLALMPGSTQGTGGFMRSVLLGSNAVRRGGATLEASIAMVEFLGGKVDVTGDGEKEYHIPKRWTTENLLGFGYRSMWRDPDVIEAISQAGDLSIMERQKELTRTKEGMQYAWYSEWIEYLRGDIQNALLGIQTTERALENIARRWNSLKLEFSGW